MATPARKLFDVEPYRVSTSPNIWVFDDLLSSDFLAHMDSMFDANQEAPTQHWSWDKDRSQTKRAIEFSVDDNRTCELVTILRRIFHMSEQLKVVPEARAIEVEGDPQHAHMDRHDWSRLARFHDVHNLVDIEQRFSSPPEFNGHEECTRIIPTISFVVYFNGVGGCNFPRAGQTITGKRGRIIMFQVIIDPPWCHPTRNTCLAELH